MKYYDSLVKLEEVDKNNELGEGRLREDELIYDPKEHEEEKSKKEKEVSTHQNKRGNNKESANPSVVEKVDEISTVYKKWFFEENKKLLKSKKNPTQISNTPNVGVNNGSLKARNSSILKKPEVLNEEKEVSYGHDSSIISFVKY